MKKLKYVCVIMFTGLVIPSSVAIAASNPILEEIQKQANGVEFSAKRGEELFSSRFTTGKPDTPSCTSCHTTSPHKAGKTRAGKVIAPMALSKSPKRYTDPKKVAKWFRRNCRSVLGRDCTATEKGDFLTYMMSQ